jgi:hypothetical protein
MSPTGSPPLVDLQDDDAPEEKTYPLGAWEYHSKLIPGNAAKPLRVFLAASEMDNHCMDAEATHFNWLLANRHLSAALQAKGYHSRFVYAKGAGHCDAKVRRATLPDTLSLDVARLPAAMKANQAASLCPLHRRRTLADARFLRPRAGCGSLRLVGCMSASRWLLGLE